jgi:hypothetical protein
VNLHSPGSKHRTKVRAASICSLELLQFQPDT